MTMSGKLITLIAATLLSVTAAAQEDSLRATRLVTRSLMVGGGYSNVLETYLTPLEYTGGGVRVVLENMRNTRWMHGKLRAQHLFQINYSYTHNTSGNAHIHYGLASYSYSLFREFALSPGLKLLAGPTADVNAGVVYNLRNSNNPAQAKAYGRLGATGMLIYRFRVKGRPFAARYQASLPLLGVAFSPEYGESYYEIFSLGNGSGTVLFTSLHNNPSLRQMLTLDFPLGKAIVRFGYICDIQQSKLNSLKSHAYSHDFMLGYVRNIYIMNSRCHFRADTKHIPF